MLSQIGNSNQVVVAQGTGSHDNTISVSQTGIDNYVGAASFGGGDSVTTITQTGDRNTVGESPNASNNHGTGIGSGTYGSDNVLNIVQNGTDNTAYADSSNDSSIVDIAQNGELNDATVESWWGTDNEIFVSQVGNNHVTDVYVDGGSNNHVNVNQTDSFNTAIVTSVGSSNTVLINQGTIPTS